MREKNGVLRICRRLPAPCLPQLQGSCHFSCAIISLVKWDRGDGSQPQKYRAKNRAGLQNTWHRPDRSDTSTSPKMNAQTVEETGSGLSEDSKCSPACTHTTGLLKLFYKLPPKKYDNRNPPPASKDLDCVIWPRAKHWLQRGSRHRAGMLGWQLGIGQPLVKHRARSDGWATAGDWCRASKTRMGSDRGRPDLDDMRR